MMPEGLPWRWWGRVLCACGQMTSVSPERAQGRAREMREGRGTDTRPGETTPLDFTTGQPLSSFLLLPVVQTVLAPRWPVPHPETAHPPLGAERPGPPLGWVLPGSAFP